MYLLVSKVAAIYHIFRLSSVVTFIQFNFAIQIYTIQHFQKVCQLSKTSCHDIRRYSIPPLRNIFANRILRNTYIDVSVTLLHFCN